MDAEKPLECSLCQRKAKVTYKEIVNGKMQITAHCDKCPILQNKLQSESSSIPFAPRANSSSCNSCKLTFEEFIMEGKIGCSKCYDAFEKALIEELAISDAIALRDPMQYIEQKKMSLHLGKIPKITTDLERKQKIESLQTALSEAIRYEKYEEAANIRDQIQVLTENREVG